jgi:integrase
VNKLLNVAFSIFKSAMGHELVQSNPVASVQRPKVERRRWRILEPREVPRVRNAFGDDRACRVFLTLALTGLRRSELVALRWRHVNLVEGTLRVDESKSEEGERLIALPASLVDEFARQFTASPFRSDDDYVFAHPERGTKLDAGWYRRTFQARSRPQASRGRSERSTTCGTQRSRTSPPRGPARLRSWRRQGIAPCPRQRATCTWPVSYSATSQRRSNSACSGYKIRVQTARKRL